MWLPAHHKLSKSSVTVCLSLFCVCVKIIINFPNWLKGARATNF